MKSRIEGAPAFAHVHLELDPGETITAEADAMATMAADLDMKARFNGGCLAAGLKKIFGGETLFVNDFTNNTNSPKKMTLVQPTPGEIRELDLDGSQSLCFQPGAYLASTPGVDLGLKWAGFGSWIGGEGLFKLVVSGQGKVWYGAYGSLLEREVSGEFIVDTGHLVAYEPQMKLKPQLSGGIFSSFFSGEGLVTRVEGHGKVIIQTRSLDGLKSWLNPRLLP